MFFSSAHSKSVALGIDIGTTAIKAAELSATGKGAFTLSNYAILEVAGHLDHFNNALQSSSLRPLESDLVSYLTTLRKHVGFKTNHVVASLPPFTAFTTLLEVPSTSTGEITKTLVSQAKDYIPLPITEMTLDWINIGEKTGADGAKKQVVFLVLLPNEKVESYKNIFSKAGFVLDGFEIENVSVARALTHGNDKPVLIIDIGGRSTSFTVAKKGTVMFGGQTDFSSGSLTQALATALNISPRRADSLKHETLIVGGSGSHELSTILVPIIDVILNEALRTKAGFEKTFNEPVSQAFISGSGANMPGLEQYLSERLKVPVTVANVLGRIGYPPEIGVFTKQLGATLTVATGLALKHLL